MRRGVWTTLLVAAVVLGAGGVATGTKRKSACERLRGGDLAPARFVKLVKRPNADSGTDLVGCALPRGRVRTFAASADLGTTQHDYELLQVAGGFVLVRSRSASQYASTETVEVASVRRGDSYEVAYRCDQLGAGDCGRGGHSSSALKAYVNPRGQAAAALTFAGMRGTTISGFSPLGERRDYDSGLPADVAADSLRLAGSTASWTNAGQTYSSRLPD